MTILLLQVLMFIYSVGGVFSKLAAGYSFLSLPFFLCYVCMLTILVIYAVAWQQIIKDFPISVAYANKAVTTIWASIWGIVFFHEKVSFWQVIGIIIIIGGVVLYAMEGQEKVG